MLQVQIFKYNNTDHITIQQIRNTIRIKAITPPPPAAYIKIIGNDVVGDSKYIHQLIKYTY